MKLEVEKNLVMKKCHYCEASKANGECFFSDPFVRVKICNGAIQRMMDVEKGAQKMDTVSKSIEKIISTPVETPTKEHAKEILRNCGILDENYNIAEDYKDIIVEKGGEE